MLNFITIDWRDEWIFRSITFYLKDLMIHTYNPSTLDTDRGKLMNGSPAWTAPRYLFLRKTNKNYQIISSLSLIMVLLHMEKWNADWHRLWRIIIHRPPYNVIIKSSCRNIGFQTKSRSSPKLSSNLTAFHWWVHFLNIH